MANVRSFSRVNWFRASRRPRKTRRALPPGAVIAHHDEVERGVRGDDASPRDETGADGEPVAWGPARRAARAVAVVWAEDSAHLRRIRARGRIVGFAASVGWLVAGDVIGVRPVEEGPPEGIAGVHIGVAQGESGAELTPGRLVVALELPKLGRPGHHVARGAAAPGRDRLDRRGPVPPRPPARRWRRRPPWRRRGECGSIGWSPRRADGARRLDEEEREGRNVPAPRLREAVPYERGNGNEAGGGASDRTHSAVCGSGR